MASLAARVGKNIRNNLFAGLLMLVPATITVVVFLRILRWGDSILGPFLWTQLAKFLPDLESRRMIPGIGLVSTLLLVYLAGTLTRFYVGRKLISVWEAIIDRVPVLRTLNKAAKQFLETIASPPTKGLRRVVFVRFPREQQYIVGFVTGETRLATGEIRTNVFTPTTPNPTTGFVFLLPPDEIIESDLTVEEGMKMVVSAGLVSRSTPPHAAPPGAA